MAEWFLSQCPSCGAKNRIPLGKIGRQGRCGRCHTDLLPRAFFAEEPVDVTEARFDLVTRTSSLPVLADFWAAWCEPCRMLAPILAQLAADLSGRLLVIKVDTEAAPLLSARFAIRSIPTQVVFRSGLEVDRIVGVLPLPALRARVERFLL